MARGFPFLSASALVFSATTLAVSPVIAAEDADAQVHERFEEARNEMKDGQFDLAMGHLETLLAVNPGAVGVRYQLAVCYERLGRTASAWRMYTEVAEASKAKGQTEREQAARASANGVYARVPHVTVVVASRADPHAELDGRPLPRDAWGVAQAVDPGEHIVVATAQGHRAWQRSMTLHEGEGLTIVVPELEADVAAPAPSEATKPVEPAGSWRRTAGWFGVVGGGAVLATAGVLLLVSRVEYTASGCKTIDKDTRLCPDESARSQNQLGLTLGDLSTGAAIAGGVLVVGGGVVLLTAPSSKQAGGSLRLAPAMFAGGGGAQLHATW